MKTLGNTMKSVERSAANRLRQLPGASVVLGLLDLKHPSNNSPAADEDIGKAVVVGDFSYEGTSERRGQIAQRIIKILKNNDIVGTDSSVDIWVMAPEMTAGENGFMNRAAATLEHAFSKAIKSDHYMHADAVVDVPGIDTEDLKTQIGSRIGDIASGRSGEALGDIQIFLANPVFLEEVFPGLRDYNMQGGGVAVLESNGTSMEATQLWPAAPPPLEEKVA